MQGESQIPYPAEPLLCVMSGLWWKWPYPNPLASVWTFYSHLGPNGPDGYPVGEWEEFVCEYPWHELDAVHAVYSQRKLMGYRCYIEWHDHDNQRLTYYPWGFSHPDDPNFWCAGRSAPSLV